MSPLSVIGSILACMAALALVERLIPLHPRDARHRRHLAPNLALTALTFATNVVFNGGVLLLLVWCRARGIGLVPWLGLGPVAGAAVAIVGLDFSFWVAHVAMHEVPAFWRFHRVHHCDPVVDVTTTIRQHPLEGALRYGFLAAFGCALGAGVGAFAIYRVWSALGGLLEHANVRVPRRLAWALSLLTTWPDVHKVHHARDPRETDTNYGNIFSWFDRLFGTFTPAARGPAVVCGLDGLDDPATQRTAGLLALPFRPEPAATVAAAASSRST